MSHIDGKPVIRRMLRDKLAAISPEQRHSLSQTACNLVTTLPEFHQAQTVMLFLSTPHEIDTAPLAIKCWQEGKTVVVPKVSWEQRRMLPVEISSLQTNMTTTGDVREPISGKPVPVGFIDFVVVPGLGFTTAGFRIGRGMGFYDRFLAQSEFIGISCGLAFEDQVIPELPVLDHDVPLSMLVTNQGIRRFASKLIQS